MRKRASPFSAGLRLMFEAQQVIGLRMMKLMAGGPSADREAKLMFSEKVAAAGEAGRRMSAGLARGSHDKGSSDVVRMLGRKVRANRKRLSRGG